MVLGGKELYKIQWRETCRAVLEQQAREPVWAADLLDTRAELGLQSAVWAAVCSTLVRRAGCVDAVLRAGILGLRRARRRLGADSEPTRSGLATDLLQQLRLPLRGAWA